MDTGPAAMPAHPSDPKQSRKGLWIGCVVAVAALVGISYLPKQTDSPAPAQGAYAGVAEWRDGGGTQHAQAVGAAAVAVGQSNNPAEMRAHCVNLGVAVDNALRYTSIPDLIAQRHWEAALLFARKASAACVTGVDSNNAALLEQSAANSRSATSQARLANARLDEVKAGG